MNKPANPEHTTSAFLRLAEISKAFPGVQALDRASLSVESGEIHGLVGENGAGKSTIIKVLAGVYQADSGSISIDGSRQTSLSARSVHNSGVRFIHQELHLVPHFTVAESVFMGQELPGLFGLRKREMKKRAEAFLRDSLHYELDGNLLIRDLGVAERKLVQIARALIDNEARVVVFDEPTGPLASSEVDQLFTAIRQLRTRGIAIVYVSHYLGEITELCDRVTVFRNGTDVAVLDKKEFSNAATIIQHMVGRDIESLYPDRQVEFGQSLLKAKDLSLSSRFRNINLDLRAGEIVGVAGLVGSGREELIDVLYGLQRASSGVVEYSGTPMSVNSPHGAVANGVVLIPRDRRNAGLVLDMTMADNINLASLEDVSVARLEHKKRGNERAAQLAEKLDIRPRDTNAICRYLSGGNQQKVVLARWLATGSKVFIMDEPTIGVDIGAKVEIYQLISDLATEGAAVLVSSSDPAELLGLCDRIIVLLRGEVIAEEPAAAMTLDSLLALTTGGAQARDIA